MRKSNQEIEQLEKIRKENEHKMEQAEQLRKEALENRVTVAKKWSSKLDKAMQTREEMERTKEDKLKFELERDEQGHLRNLDNLEATSNKAKSHLEKV